MEEDVSWNAVHLLLSVAYLIFTFRAPNAVLYTNVVTYYPMPNMSR